MIPTQSTHRVDDLIHLPQIHAVHLSVQFVKVLFEASVIHFVGFSIGFVEQYQYGFSVTEILWIFCDIGSQLFKVSFQVNHLQSVVMLTLSALNYK